MNQVGADTTHDLGVTPRKFVAEERRVDKNSEVTWGTVSVLVEGIGSKAAGLGVAVPDGAVDREAGVVCLGGGIRMSTA